MSYEDSFDREAEDERAYKGFERWYLYEHLKPETIGRWEWDLMFDHVRSRYIYSEAVADSLDMACEMRVTVTIQRVYEGCWQALPLDYYAMPEGFSGFTYTVKRGLFIKALVLARKYPDIVALADAMNHPDKHGISRHFWDERERHQRWLKESEGL